MSAFITAVLDYCVNAAWQLPLLFGGAWVATRLTRRLGPAVEHVLWTSALLLSVALPACTLPAGIVPHAATSLADPFNGSAKVLLGAFAATPARLTLTPAAASILLVVYVGALLFSLLRLLRALAQTSALRRSAHPVDLAPEGALAWRRTQAAFGVAGAPIAISGVLRGPAVIGIRNPLLLLPTLLTKVDATFLETVFAHECAHLRRNDFTKNLLCEIASLPLSFHPVAWMLRSRVRESREMVCDQLAADALGGSATYARNLLTLAEVLAVPHGGSNLYAIGIFDAHTLQRRLMKLKEGRLTVTRTQRISILLGTATLAVLCCASVVALHVHAASSDATSSKRKDDKAAITPMEILYKKPPIYPAQARLDKNTLNGAVIITLSIDETGTPQNVHVSKSLRADYDQSALDAVREWRFKPAEQAGKPLAVDTSIAITYSLTP